jgi:hypothetical protein
VELVATQLLTGLGDWRATPGADLAVAERHPLADQGTLPGDDAGHPVTTAVGVHQGLLEVHQAAALGVDREAGARSGPQRVQHRRVDGKLDREQLRKAAAQVDPADSWRQRPVAQRAERHQLGAPGA